MTSDKEDPDKGGRPAAGQVPSGQTASGQRPRPTSKTKTSLGDDERTIVGPRPVSSAKPASRKLTLSDVLERQARSGGSASNPMIAAANGVLELLGLLRTGLVEMDALRLQRHLHAALTQFEADARDAGISDADINDARYALAATCDDIAQNLPGANQVYWKRHSLTAHFFADPNPGVGFFIRLHRMSGNPSRHAMTLELMFVCLGLGFEGQYRSARDGQVALSNLRTDLYHRIRSVVPRAYPDMSCNWAPVVLNGARRHHRVPLWIITGIGASMVVVLYGVLAWTLTKEAQAAQSAIIALHDPTDPIAIERVALPDVPVEPQVTVYEAPKTGQVDRVRDQLADEIAAGLTTVSEEGDFIAVRLGEALQFGEGAAVLASESPIIARIATVLENEPGSIIVEGHSDNIPLSGRGRYKTNEELSAARAAAVSDVLAQYMSDPDRMTVEGAGASKPLIRADTPEARSRNRRVDILLLKEQRL